MKRYMRFATLFAALIMVSSSIFASGKVKLYGTPSNVTYAVSTAENGTYTTVTADGVEHAKNTTVYLKVTPTSGYTIAKSAITVKQAVSGTNAQTRTDGPVIVGTINLAGNDPTDLSSERIYTFTMPNDDNINVLISGDATAAIVEEKVSTTKSWTFDDLTVGTVYSSYTAINGLYLRTVATGRSFTVTEGESTNITFADGQPNMNVGKYLALNANALYNNDGALTATSTAGDGQTNGTGMIAINATVAGTFSVKIKGGTSDKVIRMYFANGTSVNAVKSITSDGTIQEISYTSTEAGSFFVGGITTGTSEIYAARFVPSSETVKYAFTLSQPSTGGTISAKIGNETIEGSTEVLPGAEVTLTATPADGYQISSWKDGNNGAVGTIPQSISTTVTMPAKDLTVTADFKAQPSEPTSITSETVWTFDGFDNGMKLSGAGTYEYNGLYIGGHSETNFSTIVAGSSAVETGISDNVTNYLSLAGGYDKDIAATVEANTYKTDAISFKAGVPGLVLVYMSGKYATGRNFNIWTNGTKHATAMTDDNATLITQGVAQGSVFIATSAGAAKIYAIKFVPATTYTLTVTQPSEGGTIKIGDAEAATQDIVENQEVTLTAVAVSGYEFDYWTVDGNKDTEHTTATLTITMSQAHSVTAAFKKSTEKTVGSMKTWTYDSMTAEEVFNSITAINDEYYLRGSASPNRTLTIISLDSPEEIEFADGSKVTVNQILTSNGSLANAGSADFTKDFTAGSSAQNSSSQLIASGALAFNTTVAGTCYVYMSGTTASTAEKKQYLRIYFADGESLSNSQVEVTEANKPIAVSKTVTGPGTFLIASPTTAYSIYAVRFVPTSEAVKYTLTLTQPSAGGTIAATVNGETFEGSTEVLPGAEVTLTATPADGYQISSWKDGSNSAIGTIPQSISTTVTMPAKELTVTADFKAQPSEPKSISSETVWTFDGFDNGMKLSGAGTYEYNGLYIGGHHATNFSTIAAGASAVETGISDNVTNYLSLAGGYDKDIASTVEANTYKTDAISFKAGVPGLVLVYMSGKYATGRNFNIWTNGTKHTTAMTDDNATLITQGVAQGSVFIATSAGAAKIYAIKFMPEAITQPTVSVTDEGKVTIVSGASSLSSNYSTYVELKTYYTTDGSEPSATNGTEYTEPFEPGSCTVKAVTVNVKTGNGSESASKEVVIHIAPSTGVPVILVAGQSNTDGRIKTTETAFPYNLNHTMMSYCNGVDQTSEGNFTAYGTTPKSDSGECWGYDAIIYNKVQEALGGNTDFYVIKQSKGNTAVNLMCAGNGQHWWSANPVWLDRNTSANQGGQSLLLALKGNIDKSLKALEDAGKEYDIKFLMWHQGEGDRGRKEQYETQLKAVINEVRNYLVERTGNNKYSNLPFILGGIASVSKEGTDEVETAKQNLAASDANIYYAPTGEMTLEEDFRSDQVHFNATGAEKIANSVWSIITTNNLMNGITIAGTDTKVENPLKEDVVSETKTFTFSTAETINTSKSIDGFYAHGVKVSKKSYGEVTFADGTTANAEYAATSGGADRTSYITERLTGGNGLYTRIFGMNASGKGTFMAIVRGTSTTDIIHLKLNGEEVQAIPVTSADENILLTGKTTGKGSFFICNSESSAFDVLAVRFVAGETTIETVKAPTIEAGSAVNTVKIIPGTSDQSGVTLTTYYTTDGSTPSATNGTKYVDGTAISLTADCTIKAITISSKGGKAYSVPYSFTYSVPTATTVYDFAAVGATETLTYGDKGTTSYYFWTESKAKDGSTNFRPITNTNLAADNRILIRVEDKDVADGKVNYALTSAGISPTTTTRALVIDNLNEGDRVRIESTGTIQYVSSAEVGEATISDAVVTQGATLDAKTTLTVTKGSYIVLLPAKGAVISKISINADEAMKPTISEPTENSDGSKTYTVKINEGETLHYTAPDVDGEKTVTYAQTTNGSYQIKVTESGKLVCWTTLTAQPNEKSDEVTINVALAKDEPTEKITIHTIGDSTMSSYDQSIPAQKGMDGWGDYLIDCMKDGWVTVYNWADRGEGAKSYFNGIWSKTSTDRPEFGEPIMNKVEAGHHVIIQFGHNDSKAYDTSTYEEWIGKLVDAVSEKGAYPIIASSICRRRFENGEINKLGQINSIDDAAGRIPATPVTGDIHEYDYPYHAKMVAQAKNIPFIDVTAGTKKLYETYGEDKSAAFFPSGEKTHTNKLGAQTIAKVVAQILFDDNTVLKKYVNTDALTLPDKESLVVENVIDNFKDEDVVTKRTIWTFNDKTTGNALADGTNPVVSQNGLYVRGYEGKAIIAAASEASPVVFSDGTKQSVKVVAQTETLNTSGVNSFGSNTAGRAAASALAPTFAVNIGTPGTFYAIVAPTTDEANRSLRLIFSGKEVINKPVSEAYAASHHWYEMKYHAETTGVVYLSFGVPTDLYAAMFVPDMEAGTEEDFNYQMVLTRSDGYWTYNNMSGSNQAVPDGLTVYAVTEINADGKAILADYGKVIPEGVGVIVKGNPNTEYALPSTTEQATYSGTNLLVPNTELRYLPATEDSKTNYYFDGTKFIKATGFETIHEKQAYLSVSATADEIPLDIPEPEVVPPYGEYDFRKFAVENVSGNTDKITAEKDANGVLTGKFTSTADNITINGSMTLNDAFSVTGSKASNVKLRKNGSTLTSTTSGLFINKSQATLNLLHLKEGNYFKIEYDGGLTFASTNVKKQGASSNVAEGDEVVSGASYMIESGSEVSLTFGKSDAASYIFTIIISEGPIVELVEGDLFISPNGNDNNAGTREAPLKTLKAAQEKAQSGNTIAILPGTYQVTNAEYMDKSSSTWNVVYNLDKKDVSYIGEVGSDGKRPVFDFSSVSPEDGKRITGFLLKTSGITIKNIESVGIRIPESSSNVQSENFRLNGASDCLIKNVAAHDGYGVGFYLTGKTKNCVIEDCDAYNNADKINNTGENNDGFGCHVSENCPGNKFVRCRAWYNADDGFDFISCYSVATIEDCIAWRNGKTDPNFSSIKGNGNGFKAGGYGMKSDETGKAHPMHVVTGSIAVDQLHGFYANHHLAGLKFENNRAYKNSVDYLMTNRKGEGTSGDDLTDVDGYGHELTGNISYGNTDITKVVGMIDTETCTLAGNSFAYSNGEWTNKAYSDDDFVSVKVSDLLLDRDEEGNLPEAVFNFMKLKVPAEVIEDPTVTLKSADESKSVYTVTYPADAELHYKLPGSTKEQKATTSTTADIEVTTAGILQVWAVKGNSSSSIVKQSVLLLAPVVYDFANTTSDIKADDGTKVRKITYKDHNDKAQRNQDFWYVTEESANLRVLTYKEAGKYTQGTGLSLTKENRPIAIEGVKAGDFIRIFHNGGTLLDGNLADIGTTVTDANGNAITDGIKSGQLIKITATAGNVDDYAVFQSTTKDFTITKVVINTALDPVVEKDDAKSTDSKWVYNVSFCEDETLHYTSPDVSGEQTVNYTGNPVTIEVSKTGKLICWTTVGSRTSEEITRTVDMANVPAEINLESGYQTYYAETALDFSEVSTDVLRAYIVKATTTSAETRAATKAAPASQLELVEVTKVPAKTALILWGKKATTVEIPQAAQTTVAITQVDGTEVNATVNLLKKAVKTERADANETYFVPNTEGELSFEYSSFVTRNGIYIEIPTSVVGEDAKEITLGEPQDDGTIVPLETAVAAIKNITPILDSEKSDKSKKVYLFKFDSSLKLYYKRPGQDTEFRAQSYKEEYKDGYPVSSSNSGYLEYYVMKDKESSRTDAQEIVLAPKATRTNLDKSSATYEISFFDGATLYYTLGDEAEKSTDEGSPLELTVTKGVKITAYSKTKTETTESLSTNLYAPTPSIVNDSVYGFANIKEEIGIDYVLTSTGYEEEKLTLGNIELYKPNALTSQTLDIFAFSAPRADGKGETSDWRLLNAGRLRAAKSEVDKHLLIQGAKKGNMLLLTYSGATVKYVESLSTAKLAESISIISSNTKYEVLNDGDILLEIAADANNNCDITVISLSSKYNPSSSSGSSSSSDDDKKTSSTAAVTIALDRVSDGIAYYSFTWESGAEMRYTLDDDETELSAGTSGSYIMEVSEGVKVKCWTVTDGKASKTVSSNLFPPTSAMAVDGNYDFAEPSDELFADMPITLDMDKKVLVEGQALYLPNALTYETFKDRFAFSELAKTSTLRMRKNRTLAFAKGEDVLMGILNLKAGDIVAFDYTGIIQIVNSGKVKEETSSSRTRGAGNGSQMVSGESYVVLQDCDLLLNVVLEDTTAIINKMYVGAVPGRSDSKAIDFVTAGEEFESLEFGRTSSVYIYNKEKAVNFKWLENESNELPIDHKISTEGGNGELTTSGLTAGNRRIAIYDLGVGDKIKLRFSGGSVTYEGHETNGNVVSINGRRLTPQDTLQTGDIITVDKLNYLYNYVVLKLDSKVSVSGIYINSEENEKVWMPTIVDKGNNTVLITAGQSSLGNKVTTCYTTDGSEPTRTNGTSGPYDEFDVQLLKGGIVTIKAVSFTEGGVYSRVAELTIFADDLIGGGNAGSAGTRRATGTYDMQGNKVEAVRNGKLYIRDGKVVFFGVEK